MKVGGGDKRLCSFSWFFIWVSLRSGIGFTLLPDKTVSFVNQILVGPKERRQKNESNWFVRVSFLGLPRLFGGLIGSILTTLYLTYSDKLVGIDHRCWTIHLLVGSFWRLQMTLKTLQFGSLESGTEVERDI